MPYTQIAKLRTTLALCGLLAGLGGGNTMAHPLSMTAYDSHYHPAAKSSFVSTHSAKEISWDDLMPANWDPAESFTDLQDLFDLPDTDPKVQALYDRMRKVWDEAPVVDTFTNQRVRLPGYVVPLEQTAEGIREFLLVPYFGACIHTPPPPANQIIHVKSAQPIADLQSMDTVWIQGALQIERGMSEMGTSGYTMPDARVTPYEVPQS